MDKPQQDSTDTIQKTVQPDGKVKNKGFRIDLFKLIPLTKKICQWRSLQFLLVFPTMVIFLVFLYSGLFGSTVGNRNIIVIFVWIFWWFLLITFMVPFASRIWCLVCPFPFFGEWFQRLAFIKVRVGKMLGMRNKMYGLNKRWPKFLSNIWLQNILFLGMCTFSAMLLTRPIVSVIALGGLFFIATVLSMIYRQRTFCMYLCPVGGFQGLYAMTSMLELRATDKEVCRKTCKTKNCLTGSEKGWGCPWFQYMGKMERNNYCGMCMECVKSCPNDNISLNVRPFCSDTLIKGYDEAWKSFIMLALAMVYSVTLLGPYGTIKDWANVAETRNWKGFGIYAAIIWFTALVAIPSVWALGAWLGKVLSGSDKVSTKEIFIRYSYMLVPLGLLAWIAFSFPLIMINGLYIVSIVSDPLGWGWNLVGTADIPWAPIFSEYTAHVQIPLLLLGLFYAIKRGYDISLSLYQDKAKAARSLIPLGVVCTVVVLAFLKLFTG
ncbi:MAG: 4Fe-4S binding protein [Planctomycetes bacterium]|nr:4Fe-4S binding protein [Planctomycetota bacterium]